jgi:hypothetical protein
MLAICCTLKPKKPLKGEATKGKPRKRKTIKAPIQIFTQRVWKIFSSSSYLVWNSPVGMSNDHPESGVWGAKHPRDLL